MGNVASTIKTAIVSTAIAVGTVAMGVASIPIAAGVAAAATLAGPMARGVNYLRKKNDPTYGDNLRQYNSKFANHTDTIIELWERIYQSPSLNILDRFNNIIIYQPVTSDIQTKFSNFDMENYMTLFNKCDKLKYLIQEFYVENNNKSRDNFVLFDNQTIKYNDFENTKKILESKTFSTHWLNGKSSSNNPILKSIYDSFIEKNTKVIKKMINDIDDSCCRLSDDIIWSEKFSVDEFKDYMSSFKDLSVINLLNAISFQTLALQFKLKNEINYYRGIDRTGIQVLKAWTQGMVDILYRSGFSADETADAYEKHIDVFLRGILYGSGYGCIDLSSSYKNAFNKINSVIDDLSYLKKHINPHNNSIKIFKEDSFYNISILPHEISTLDNIGKRLNEKLNEIGINCSYNKSSGKFQFWSPQNFRIVGRGTTIFKWIGLEPNDYNAVDSGDRQTNNIVRAVTSQNVFPINQFELGKYIDRIKINHETHTIREINDNIRLFLVNMKRVTYLERMRVNSEN